MKRTCRKCGEEFECRDAKPGHIDDCMNCIQDPERAARLSGEIVLNGQVYVKAGLPMITKPFRDSD